MRRVVQEKYVGLWKCKNFHKILRKKGLKVRTSEAEFGSFDLYIQLIFPTRGDCVKTLGNESNSLVGATINKPGAQQLLP